MREKTKNNWKDIKADVRKTNGFGADLIWIYFFNLFSEKCVEDEKNKQTTHS